MNPPILPDSLYFYLFWDSLLGTVYLTSISKEVWESALIKRQRDTNLEASLIFWLSGWLHLESKAKLLNMPVRDVLDWQWSYEDPLYMRATANGSSPLEGAQKKKVLAFPPAFLTLNSMFVYPSTAILCLLFKKASIGFCAFILKIGVIRVV